MKKALGRGLSALIPDSYVNAESQKAAAAVRSETANQTGFRMIPIVQIHPNPDQPRKIFSDEQIHELAASIKEKGVLQPIVVKKIAADQYELICGERRLRAAGFCGLEQVPAVIKDIARDEFLEWALIENIQRQDLSPLEEAEAYQRLAEERILSHDEIAKRLGKSRVTVTNTLRLLRLPEEVKVLIAADRLTAGHARALLGLLTPEHQRQMAKRIAEENLSVRQVEAIVNRSNAHKRKPRKARLLNAEVIDLENRLAQHLGTQIKIHPRKNQNQGRIEIFYFNLDDLDRFIEKVGLIRS